MGPTLVTGGPPPPVRALAAELFGEVAAGRMLASMNRSACFRAHLHGSSRELTIFQHADDIMMPRLLREFSSSSRYRIHRSAQADTQQPDGHGVMVDVGCNLGDATIAAWLANAALRVLCLEPMPITYLYLRWNLLANGVPSLTPEMFAAASTKGGVLALPAGASADGRSLSIEYAPDLSGYGITSVSTDTGSIVADSGLAGTRNHAKHRVSADEFLRASGVPSLNLTAWLDAHGVSAVRFLKMVRHSGLARAHCSRCPALGGASVRYAPRVSVHMPARPLRSSRTMATSRPSPRPYPIPLVLASPSFHRPTLATPTYPGLRGL